MKLAISNNKVANNAAWIIGANIVQSIIALIIGMLSARYLGPSNYGLINYASSLVAFVAPIMRLGIGNILVREIVHNKDEEGTLLGTTLVLNLISAVVCIIGINVFCHFSNPNDSEAQIVCALYSTILIFQAVEVLSSWFQAHLLSKYSSTLTLIAYIVISAYRLFLLITHKSIYWFAIISTIEAILIATMQISVYVFKKGQRFRFSLKTGKRLLSEGRYFIVSNMMITIFAQTDKIMLKQLLSSEAVGYYSAAVTLSNLTGFMFSAIIDSFRPVIFEKRLTDKEGYENNLKLVYCIIIYLSLAQSLVMTIFAKYVVNILYGAQYAQTIQALRIVVWYTTFSYLGSVRNLWIISEKKQKYLWIINMSGAIANVILNFSLIPAMGICGAALASLVTQFFANIVISAIIPALRENNRILVGGCDPRNLSRLMKVLRKE